MVLERGVAPGPGLVLEQVLEPALVWALERVSELAMNLALNLALNLAPESAEDQVSASVWERAAGPVQLHWRQAVRSRWRCHRRNRPGPGCWRRAQRKRLRARMSGISYSYRPFSKKEVKCAREPVHSEYHRRELRQFPGGIKPELPDYAQIRRFNQYRRQRVFC